MQSKLYESMNNNLVNQWFLKTKIWIENDLEGDVILGKNMLVFFVFLFVQADSFKVDMICLWVIKKEKKRKEKENFPDKYNRWVKEPFY